MSRAEVSVVLVGFTLLMASSCTPEDIGQPAREEAGIPNPAIIANRGASHHAPEATKAAYLLARDLGATYLELDLQRTADGVLVAFHDDDLGRTTNVAAVFPGREKIFSARSRGPSSSSSTPARGSPRRRNPSSQRGVSPILAAIFFSWLFRPSLPFALG